MTRASRTLAAGTAACGAVLLLAASGGTPWREGGARAAVRIAGSATRAHLVRIDAGDHYLVVEGADAAPLACALYDSAGTPVRASAAADTCRFRTAGIGRHRLVVHNRGAGDARYGIVTR